MTQSTSGKPTKAQATEAARSFRRHHLLGDDYGRIGLQDPLMALGRLYEFPKGTPVFNGKPTIGNLVAYILEHAVEIE